VPVKKPAFKQKPSTDTKGGKVNGTILSLIGPLADLREAGLRGADLREADLREANLRMADLREADLWKAHLEGANLVLAQMQKANLFRAHLPGAKMGLAKLEMADLREADLREADLEGADLRKAHLEGANLREARLPGAKMQGCNLEGADLEGVVLGFYSHTLLSEVLYRAAGDDQECQMVAAWIGRRPDMCWPAFLDMRHPKRRWALRTLAAWVKPGDDAPQFMRRLAERIKEAR